MTIRRLFRAGLGRAGFYQNRRSAAAQPSDRQRLLVVWLARFELATSSTRTILCILRRERKIAEGNGNYREKCRKNAENRWADADAFRELEPKNGKKKARRGYVRGYVGLRRSQGKRCGGIGANSSAIIHLPACHAEHETLAINARFAVSDGLGSGFRNRSASAAGTAKGLPFHLRICP